MLFYCGFSSSLILNANKTIMSSAGKLCKIDVGGVTLAFGDLGPNDIKGGTAGQVLQSDGTKAVFNTDLTLPGSLDVTTDPGSLSKFNATTIYGSLTLSNDDFGTAGQQVVCNGSGIPEWKHLLYYVQYYQNAPTVNMNGADPTALFANASPDQVSSKIVYTAGNFTINDDGVFNVRVRVRTSTSDACTLVCIRKNGGYLGSTKSFLVAANTEPQDLLLEETIVISSGDVIDVVSRPISGATISTSGSDENGRATSQITIQKVGPSTFI